MTRFIIFILISLTTVLSADAQDNPDFRSHDAARFNIGVNYEHDWKQGISDTYSARITYEFLKTRHFSLIASGRYVLNQTLFADADISPDYNPAKINMNGSHGVGQVGITASFRTRLFGKPLVGAAIINSDWAAGGFAKVTSIVMCMVMLRADKDTQFGLGPMALINTNGKLPALIAFMFRHRFNDRWLINLSGGLFAMEYSPSRKNLLTMGFDINARSFYFRPEVEALPDNLKYMSVSFRPLIRYSRTIAGNLNLEAKAGVAVNIVNRVNGMTGAEKYLDCRQNTVYPFVQAGMSYAF